jgi:hypothetical protein
MPGLLGPFRSSALSLGVALVTATITFACGDDSAAPLPPDDDAGGPIDGGRLDAGRNDAGPVVPIDAGTPEGQVFEVRIGPLSVDPGVEQTQCASFDLGNEAPGMVRGLRTHLSAGSHHMIVYRLDGPADPTLRPCAAFEHGVADSLFIAESAEADLAYPSGAGLRVAAHQTIGLEIHYINYVSRESIDVEGAIELDVVPDAGDLAEVHLLFTGPLSLSLPPRERTTMRSFQGVPAGARVFGLTSHTHQLGTLATIHRGTSESDLGDELHRSTSWAEPPLDRFDPPLMLEADEGLVLTCEYNNTTDRPVGFGTSFYDEMCFLWAYWY